SATLRRFRHAPVRPAFATIGPCTRGAAGSVILYSSAAPSRDRSAPPRRDSAGHSQRRPPCRRTRTGHRPATARSAARRARTAPDASRHAARACMKYGTSRFLRPRDYYDLTRNSIRAWQDDYAASLGAAIAFYTAFSVAPLMIIIIAVAGFVWGEEAVRGELIRQLGDLVGSDAAAGIQALIRGADQPSQGVTATLISVGVLVW